jgi:anti-anti-sigma regulatory factor/anti-sigma regulatory factor (Ser/Thr protein kinase)
VERIGTRLLVRCGGELCVATVPQVRAALIKCLVEQPDAVIADLAGTVVIERTALSVFAAVARQAALWPGTPLLISGTDRQTAEWLVAGHSRLLAFPSADEALAAESRRLTTSVSDLLLPLAGSAQRARHVTVEACIRWELPELAAPASLVVSELVANAVMHAETMIDLRVNLGRRYLMIAVRDGSSAPPRLPPGSPDGPASAHGLHLVDALTMHWGSMPAEGGKVVWATLART